MTCDECGEQVDSATRELATGVKANFAWQAHRAVDPFLPGWVLKPCGHRGSFTITDRSPTWPVVGEA